jgi:hypothetical protein
MPRQLIYTSAPRGLTPGQSGYCTVARSRDLREALIPRLEKLSYYTPDPNHNPIICAHRVLDLRGTKFHVLSRIVDSGHDFTKRRRFLAHHLIFEPSELPNAPAPAEIFLKWKGWLDQWQGDPQWLEDNRPLPARAIPKSTVAKSDLWITGDETDRENFLRALVERGADWEITFTNCFQPGDDPVDFDIKAVWPKTPGYETAKRLDAHFIRLNELPLASKPQAVPAAAPPPQKREAPVPARISSPRPKRLRRLLPLTGAALTLIAFVATLYVRHRVPSQISPTAVQARPAPIPRADVSAELNILLPNRPTWLALQNQPTPIPPIEELMRELRANEIFTKDLTCSVQTNLHAPSIPTALFADPGQNLIRFTATNQPPIEILVANGCAMNAPLADSFAVEIPGRFRLLAIKTPVEISRRFLLIDTNVELRPDFQERIHSLEIPSGSQFALRPLVPSKAAWIDPLAGAAHDFALIPSTILDLPAVEARARKIISDKESKLRAYEEEQSSLAAEQQKLLTDAQTPEQLKGKERLNVLQLAIPKEKQELDALRAKAAVIPKDPARIERFALFLCLSNVNTEVFRFTEKP